MISRIIMFTALLILVSITCVAVNLKEYIFILEPEIHAKTQGTFISVADRFKEKKMDQLSDIFRSFAEGGHGSGFLIKANGKHYIVTNRHVVNHAESVNVVKQNDDGTSVKYENCRILYIDNEIDVAFLAYPGKESEIAGAFPISDADLSDGDEVWSAGFPGLLGKPGWQFAKGNITNRKAFIDELLDIKISHVIQHSAPIDPGNSGGPLLIRDKSSIGYGVAGINTWQIGARQNTNFAIPASLINKLLLKVKEAEKIKENPEDLKDELVRNCMILASELASDNPDWDEVKHFISYSFVGEKGWESFLFALNKSDKKTQELWEKSFFNVSPIETMRAALYIAFWNSIRKDKEKPRVEFENVNFSDTDEFGKGSTIRTNFKVNEKSIEISWQWEFGHFRISFANLDSVLGTTGTKSGDLGTEKASRSTYPFSFVGLQMLMTDLKLDNKELYDKLLPDYTKLEARQNSSNMVIFGGVMIGGSAAVIGTLMIVSELKAMYDFDYTGQSNYILWIILSGGGIALISLSAVIGASMAPTYSDIMGFMNTHNKHSDTPLQLQK